VDVDTLKKARQSGADEVVARSRFVSAFPKLVQKHFAWDKDDQLNETCFDTLHPKAIAGFALFNTGDYYGAHEFLEDAWKEDLSPGRDLYRGILQVAVAYFQIQQHNFRGALKMFQRSRYWLQPLPEICRGVQVAALRASALVACEAMLALGADNLSAFNKDLFEPVRWEETG
jgi:predicted metal-dependent hydrolase